MTVATEFKPLTKEDVAEVLGISLRTVENWVNEGTLLPPKKIGNRVYWHPSAFYTWLDQCLADTVATDAALNPTERAGIAADAAKTVLRKKNAKVAKTEQTDLRNRSCAKLDALLNS